jgi:hypothetical protein
VYRLLDDSILYGRDTELSCAAIRLGDFDTAHWRCLIFPLKQRFQNLPTSPLHVIDGFVYAATIYAMTAMVPTNSKIGIGYVYPIRYQLHEFDCVPSSRLDTFQ